jgi:hypothetical protein
MKTIISLIFISLALVGCSPVVLATAEPKEPASNKGTNPSLKPSFSMTAGPPAILLVPDRGNPAGSFPTPTPMVLEGWQIFNSAPLHIAVNYPSNWSVTEQTNGATFASPAGAIISLQTFTFNGTSTANQQCADLITSYGQTANLCVEAGMYSAEFNLQLADGSSESLLIFTNQSEALDVYKEMITSLRPTQ